MTIDGTAGTVLSESHQSSAASSSSKPALLIQIQPRNGPLAPVSYPSLATLAPPKPRPAYLYYPRPDDSGELPVPLVRQLNWSFYTDCQDQEDYPESSDSVASRRRLLPQTEEALRLLREIDSNIAAVGPGVEFEGENGFRALLVSGVLLLFSVVFELQFDSEKDLLGMECATLRCKVDFLGILFDVRRKDSVGIFKKNKNAIL